MAADLESQLKQLPGMKRADLRALWQDLFGKLPHPALRREVLVPILAYRLQENVLGGLKASTARRLRSLVDKSPFGKGRARDCQFRPKAGTRIVREWHGRLHEVTALVTGFEYEGERYRSLSEIARKITGTRWSGPAFFGLNSERRSAA